MNEDSNETIVDVLKSVVDSGSITTAMVDVAMLGMRISEDDSQDATNELLDLALIGKLVVNGSLKLDLN